MTPSADPAAAAAMDIPVPARYLENGEIVVLAMKPSPWFVVLISLPVLGFSAAIGLLAWAVWPYTAVPRETIYFLCLSMTAARILIALFQWTSRLYVLTNRRVLRIRGVLKEDVFQCPLNLLRDAALTATRSERLLGIGSIYFTVSDPAIQETAWLNLNRPAEIHKLVLESVQRSRR